MQRDIHAVPAYGRDYRSKAAVLKDWQDGKDFQDALTGRYFSIRDAKEMGLVVWVRYDKRQKITKVT